MKKKYIYSFVLLLSLCFFSNRIDASDKYYFIDIGEEMSFANYPVDINDNGIVVGFFNQGGKNDSWYWNSKHGCVFFVSENESNFPTGINNKNEIIGQFDNFKGGWIFKNNQLSHLSTFRRPVAINDSGKIIGEKYYASFDTDIDINNLGDVVGKREAALLNGNIIMPMYTEARAVNDLKQVVGVYRDVKALNMLESDVKILLGGNHWRLLSNSDYDKTFCYKSFLWEKEAYIKIETLGGQFSSPYDINNLSQVVGSSSIGVKNQKEVVHAFIWENGTIRDLNDLIINKKDGQEIELKIATAINNLGYITGVAIVKDKVTSFLLIPQ